MRFGKRRNWKRHDNRDNNYKTKGGARPKLAIVGAITLVIGALLVHYYGVPLAYSNRNLDNPYLIGGFICVIAGTLMLLFSLSKRNQKRVSRGMDGVVDGFQKMTRERCQCCKCQNCGRSHNHWTHD
jgi:hypothetical protein